MDLKKAYKKQLINTLTKIFKSKRLSMDDKKELLNIIEILIILIHSNLRDECSYEHFKLKLDSVVRALNTEKHFL